MKQYAAIFSLIILVITIAGCQSSRNVQYDIDTMPEANMFSMNVKAPDAIQAGKPFIVKGELTNNSDGSVQIEHGADMFQYEITDDKGEPIPQEAKIRVINSIGMGIVMQPGASYSNDGEGHVQPRMDEFTLPSGSYTIVSRAKFTLKYEGESREVEVESVPLYIKVS